MQTVVKLSTHDMTVTISNINGLRDGWKRNRMITFKKSRQVLMSDYRWSRETVKKGEKNYSESQVNKLGLYKKALPSQIMKYHVAGGGMNTTSSTVSLETVNLRKSSSCSADLLALWPESTPISYTASSINYCRSLLMKNN